MGDDASLDDFLDATDQEADQAGAGDGQEPDREEPDGTESASEGGDSTDEVPGDDASADRDGPTVEPATGTYDWTSGGAACAACDDVVERRWRDDPGFVCENCKDW